MARQGNYVPVPSGNANWAKGISDSLTGLSKNLLAQGVAESELERQKLLDAENQRRYETDLGFKQRSEAATIEERDRQAQERKALTDYATGYSADAARQAAFDTSPEMQKSLDDYISSSRDTLARNAFIEATRNQQGGQGAEFGVNMGLTEEAVPENIADRLDAAIASGQSSPMLTAYKESLDKLETDARNHVLSNMPVYREAENSRITKELLGQGVNPVEAARIGQLLSSQYNSEQDFTERAKEAQKQQQKYYDDAADRVYKSIQLTKSKASDSDFYIKPKNLTETEVEDALEALDTGIIDHGRLRDRYDAAVEEGVSPSIALQALKESVSDRTSLGFRSKAPSLGVQDFVVYAKGRQAANKKDGGSLTREEIEAAITPKRAEYVDPREANVQAILSELSQFSPRRDGLPMVLPQSNTLPTELVRAARANAASTNTRPVPRTVLPKSDIYEGVGPRGMYDALSTELGPAARSLRVPFDTIRSIFD